MRRAGHTFLLCLACLCLGPLAGSAAAAPSIESSSFSLSTAQAGAHADLTVSVALEDPGEPETARDLRIGLPPGYFLYPDSLVRCAATQWDEQECPVDSQVGIIDVRGNYLGDPEFEFGPAAVRLLAPESGEFARLGFVVPIIEAPVEVPVSVSTGSGYGLELALKGLPQTAPLQSLDFTIWGVPADPVHDEERFPLNPGGRPSSQPQLPLTRNPTFCGAAGSLTVKVDSYQDPGDFAAAASSTPQLAGCGKLAFLAALEADLTTIETSAPSGLDLAIEMAGSMNPDGLSSADAKDISVSLPPELGLDEGALAGLPTCSLAQAHLAGDGPDECPAGSKIGSFAAAVLGTEEPLQGDLYFGGATSPDAYGLFLIAAGGGIDLRLQASLEYEEATGSWGIALSDLPQLPFEELEVQFADEPGLFIAPWECGSFAAAADLTPWSGSPAVHVTSGLKVETGPEGGPCPGPAEEVIVSLAPSSIPADGASTSTATATVLDENGYLLVGEEVVFESTDPGQRIGPTTDNGDGTYTAQITASTAPGSALVFAFDESVEPEAFGFAELTQTPIQASLPSPPAILPLPPPKPTVKFRRRPPPRTSDRTPTFGFASSVGGSSFECKLDRRPLRRCKSPLTLPRLGFGRHTFKVRAVAPNGTRSLFAKHSFVVRP